jgi:outer membrane protein assembly factor BamB
MGAACGQFELDLGERPSRLHAFDRRTGTELWSSLVPELDLPRAEFVVEVVTGTIVFPTRKPVGTVALDATDGLPVWQVATDRDLVRAWWVKDGQVALVVSNWWSNEDREPQLLWIDAADGSIVSTSRWDGRTYQPRFDTIVMPWPTNTVIETISGLEIWAHCEPLEQTKSAQIEVCDHEAEPEMWIEAVDTATGHLVWRHPVASEYTSVASTSDTIYLAAAPDGIADGSVHLPSHSPIVALDVETGAELWRARFSPGVLNASVVGDVLYEIHWGSQ